MQAERGWSSWTPVTKILVVIGAVFGFFLLFAGIGFAYGLYWFYSAGDQADTQLAISETSIGYVRWVAAEDDPGIAETLDRLSAAMQKAQQQQLEQQKQSMPAPLRMLMQMQTQQAKGSFNMFWPRSVTASFEPSESGDRFVAAINPRGMGGMVKGFFRILRSSSEAREYRDHDLLVNTSSASVSFALHGSTILVGRDVQDLEAAIDRIVDQKPAQPNARLAAMERMIAPGADLYWVQRSPKRVPGVDEALPLEGVDVGFALDVVTADRWRATAMVSADSPEELARAAQATELAIEKERADLAKDGIEVTSRRSNADARTVRFDLDVTNVATALERGMTQSFDNTHVP